MNDELISAFADLCGYRDLDPVEVLKVLNAQDWRQEPAYTMSGLKIHEDSDSAA